MKKAVIVIPTYNEAKNMEELVSSIFSQNTKEWDIEILVVDSTSPDGTSEEVKKLQKKFKKLHLLITGKEGLGRAYVAGFKYALSKLNPDVLFEMDADLQHDPNKIPEFLKKIDDGADFVIGSRYIRGGSIPKDWGLDRKLFSILGNLIIRFGFMKLGVSDWTSGFRAIKIQLIKDTLDYIGRYSGYVFQIALLDSALKKHAKISEVPINFVDRTYGESKINSGQYISQTLMYVFQKSSFIRFGIVGVLGASLDFGISYIFFNILKIPHHFYWLATIISAEAAIIFNFTMNNLWSFSHKKIEQKSSAMTQSFLKFNLISGGSILIQAIGIQILTYAIGPQYWAIYKVFIIALVIIPYSYLLYNRFVWRSGKKS